jgi:hypothetical protein
LGEREGCRFLFFMFIVFIKTLIFLALYWGKIYVKLYACHLFEITYIRNRNALL